VAPFAVLDLEGNGHQPPDLVELGIIQLDDGVAGALTTWLVQPEQPISERVARFHGINNADVAMSPSFDEIKADVASMLHGRYLVAHNASIDWDVLHRKLPTLEPPGVIDTLRLARALYPECSSYKLTELLNTLGIREVLSSTGGTPHRAGYDTSAALQLFLHLVDHSPHGPLLFRELLSLGEVRSPLPDSQGRLF
jgi:DNA polymerase III epsilon subunit-like protein